ncbi:MAG TPA: gliding motility lipoprotein GldH [Saprospiraceae bacterium]|nr:gliding motility lipoprotein GldH [Saprospiraceae bacterium]HNM24294.1 gliding motility lipoprotein GldH [Saprospiraceae bacterium]
MKKTLFFAAILASLIWTACNNNVIFEQEQKIQGARWNYADTLNFSFDVSDTTFLYNLYLDFTYLDSFPHQNLYLRLHTLFPDGKRAQKLRSFNLFDPSGNPLGKSSGHEMTLQTMLQENAYFKLPGTYTITLEQYGRTDALPGIQAVSMRVEKNGKRKQ